MKAIVVGGNSGIGLAITIRLLQKGCSHIAIVGKEVPVLEDIPEEFRSLFDQKTSFYRLNLINEDYSIFSEIEDIDVLIITAGFGRVAPFKDLTPPEISSLIKCNELSIIQIVKHYYKKIYSQDDFYCAIMGSISGRISSPLFSVYGASKAGLCSFIESVNVELAADGFENRILDVSPGSIKGTNFDGQGNKIEAIIELADSIISKMFSREILYIPHYNDIYKNVLQRYHENPMKFGLESYSFKKDSGRVSGVSRAITGYLSGTFDLFHIGHLNLIKRAKMECDYLIVGIHKSGKWKGKETYIPFEERKEIVSSLKFVDLVIESYLEDSDAYDALHFNKLFVGSDYKGSERFLRYERYFQGKNVEIVYFPYTEGTSSTQLREILAQKIGK